MSPVRDDVCNLTNLHYRLEIECCAIPERKLAAVRSRKKPSTFRRPFDNVDSVAGLVQGGVEMFCWNRIGRIVWFCYRW